MNLVLFEIVFPGCLWNKHDLFNNFPKKNRITLNEKLIQFLQRILQLKFVKKRLFQNRKIIKKNVEIWPQIPSLFRDQKFVFFWFFWIFWIFFKNVFFWTFYFPKKLQMRSRKYLFQKKMCVYNNFLKKNIFFQKKSTF